MVKVHDILTQFHLEKIRLNAAFLTMEISFREADSSAAWDLYVEMLTRVVTQPLPGDAGEEEAAVASVYSLFPTFREILRRQGPEAAQFAKIAIPVLNQVVRPFTTKWHSISHAGGLHDPQLRATFRQELADLQVDLWIYGTTTACWR